MALSPFSTSSGTGALLDALLGANSGIQLVIDGAHSPSLHVSADSAISFYDGSIAPLGIGAGLLFTSGHAPGLVNDVGWDGTDNSFTSGFSNGDADIDAVVNTVFQTVSYDATTFEFDFRATDPEATSISFDVVFGSEEYPEWVDQFVDCAVVIVNGVNYALFNHDPNHPLSVVSSNLAAGYFQDNATNVLGIQYDGVSSVLKIVAPIQGGGAINHIKIGIADTGDHIYDSGIFIANLVAGNTPGSGVVVTPPCTTGDDTITGSAKDELIDLKSGNDVAYAGGGDDIVVGGAGKDTAFGGSGNDVLEGDGGDDLLDGGDGLADSAVYKGTAAGYVLSYDGALGVYTLSSANEGTDTLIQMEQVQFSDGLFDLKAGSLVPHSVVSTLPNSAGTVTISGIAMGGKILTAVATDPDGLHSAVGFEWQMSADGATNWTPVGGGQTYAVSPEDAGKALKVLASYTDDKGATEAPASAPVTVAKASDALYIELMTLGTPAGATVENPLTSLLVHAIGMGYSANAAATAIRAGLGLPNVPLQSYDAYGILASGASDATALQVLKVATQVAMTASVSDPSGYNLAFAVLEAAAAGTVLDLADPDTITGLVPDAAKATMVLGLNQDMAKAQALHGDANVELVWHDYCGKVDPLGPYQNQLGILHLHVNQAPQGSGPEHLAPAIQGMDYQIDETTLLAGFVDPNDDALCVSDIWDDQGNAFTNLGNGFWSMTPLATGPLELNFTVSDGWLETTGQTLLVVVPPAPVNHAPTGSLTVAGTLAQGATLSAAASLQDTDGLGPLTLEWLAVGSDAVLGSGATFVPGQAEVGKALYLRASYVDGAGTAETFLGAVTAATVANVNDAPGGALSIAGSVTQYQMLSVVDQLTDLDGKGAVSFTWTASGVSGPIGSGTTLALGQAQVGRTVSVTANYTDSFGATESVTASTTTVVGNLNDAPTGAVTIAGTAREGQTLTASHTLADLDGMSTATVQYTWYAGGVAIGNGSSLVLGAGQVGKTVTVSARYTDDWNTTETVDSNPTAAVQALVNVMNGTSGADTLAGAAGMDSLSGLAGNDSLSGLAGDDTLDGGAGSDALAGGAGDDTYVVDATSDVVSESAGAGTDTVRVAVATAGGTLTLAAQVERALLVNAVAFNLTGNALDNGLIGNNAANLLTGAAGADTLDGGNGADVYAIASGADHPTGEVIADTGTSGVDEVRFTATTTTGTLVLAGGTSGVEQVVIGTGTAATATTTATTGLGVNASGLSTPLQIIGNNGANALTGGSGADTLSGNSGNDTLVGDSGDDSLVGGAGSDNLSGGAGNDSYGVDAAGDVVNESVGAGLDTVTASVTYSLGAAAAAGVENLSLSGTGAINGTGNALPNLILGNSAANSLQGMDGADTLTAGLGNDTLAGGLGQDVFRFDTAPSAKTNLDRLSDFSVVDDTLQLENAVFSALTATGTLAAASLRAGAGVTTAADADDYLLYNTTTGALYYDVDGSGSTTPVQLATLTGLLILTAADFVVT